MPHLSHAAGQSTADLSEAFGLSELAEEHGNEMVPGVELFGKPFGFMSMNQFMEFFPVNKSNELTEQACMLYHGTSSLVLGNFWFVVNQYYPQGGFFFKPSKCRFTIH